MWFKRKKTPRCAKCAATQDADVIAAIGVCERCVSRDEIDGLMRGLRGRKSVLPRRDLPIKTLIDYARNPRSKLTDAR